MPVTKEIMIIKLKQPITTTNQVSETEFKNDTKYPFKLSDDVQKSSVTQPTTHQRIYPRTEER